MVAKKSCNGHCDTHKKMEEHVEKTITFMAEINTSVGYIKNDIEALFAQNRNMQKDITDLKVDVSSIKARVYTTRASFLSLSAIMMFVKKWFGMGGN